MHHLVRAAHAAPEELCDHVRIAMQVAELEYIACAGLDYATCPGLFL